MSTPTDEEYVAAVERDRAANAAYMEALNASTVLLEESITAGREVLRLQALRTDLRELLLNHIRTNCHPNGSTVATLVKRSFRDRAVVLGVLQVLTEAGMIRKAGKGYKAVRG